MSVRLVGIAAILIINLSVIEVASYLFCWHVIRPRAPFLVFTPPKIEEDIWEHYLQVSDPVLGWPTIDALKTEYYDALGSRPIPAFPDPGNECITLYGDSFTYGEEVDHEDAWSNRLAERLGCRVGNYGVGGYGTDQALLRFEANKADGAHVSILGIYPHNVMRNVSQYRYLLGTRNILSFKPRFAFADGDIKLVAKPGPRNLDLDFESASLHRLLPDETFLPGSEFGPTPLGFPYTIVVAKLLFFHEQVRNWIRGIPSWQDFIKKDHPSRALQVTVGIARRFMENSKKRGKESLVLLFPTPSSYQHYVETGELVMQPLIDEFDKLGLTYLALSPLFAKRLSVKSYCEILTNPDRCTGHYNAEGNRLVAEFVHTFLARNGFHVGENRILAAAFKSTNEKSGLD